MGYWAHSWTLDQIIMKVTGQPDRTLEEYSNNYPGYTYATSGGHVGTNVTANCKWCDYQMDILYWPSNHRVGDIGPDITHKEEGEPYTCPDLPDPDPYLVWVDDEGNFIAADLAPADAKASKPKK